MIYTKLHGRIGNHLFEIAAAATLAARNNDDFCAVCHKDYIIAPPDNCTIWEFVQPYLNTIYKRVKILENIPEGLTRFRQEGFNYVEIPYKKNILLDGAFQSYKYFDQSLVQELFAIPDSIKEEIKRRYNNIFKEPVIGVNVRRGDYCIIPHKFPVCSRRYFKKAMSLFPINSRFVFISDDIEWCKKNFKGTNIYYLENSNPLIDLYAQTLCTDNIISNSTFSWWGAYLNPNPNKKIIYPTPWFGKYIKHDKKDIENLTPSDWISIKNKLSFSLWLRAKSLGLKTKLGIIK